MSCDTVDYRWVLFDGRNNAITKAGVDGRLFRGIKHLKSRNNMEKIEILIAISVG